MTINIVKGNLCKVIIVTCENAYAIHKVLLLGNVIYIHILMLDSCALERFHARDVVLHGTISLIL